MGSLDAATVVNAIGEYAEVGEPQARAGQLATEYAVALRGRKEAVLAGINGRALRQGEPLPESPVDIVRECRFEGGSTVEFDRCSQDEAAALEQLKANWARFAGVDKSTCLSMATVAGIASYVELLTCLEMAREANNTDKKSRDPKRTDPMRSFGPGVTVGVGR